MESKMHGGSELQLQRLPLSPGRSLGGWRQGGKEDVGREKRTEKQRSARPTDRPTDQTSSHFLKNLYIPFLLQGG